MISLLKAFALTGGEWVIYLLIAASILAVAVMIERGIVLSRERKNLKAVKDSFQKILGEKNLEDIPKDLTRFSGSSARILHSGLSQLARGSESVEEQMTLETSNEKRYLEARMIILGTLGNNAVYIGLFGTVLGVIRAFHDLAQEGGSGPEVVMQGLSEALIATAVGLMVALPCVVAYNIFQKQIKDLLSETESMARLILVRLKIEVVTFMNLPGAEEESITGINIAPLVDVILVLLIIFMATAPLIQKRSLNINVPKAAHTEPKATETLNVVMNEKKEIFLGDQPVTADQLPFQLGVMIRSNPLLHVAVLADQTIPYGEVVDVLDIVRGAGVKKLALEVRSKKAQ